MGLIALVENQELQAHLRAKVMEYGTVCEGLLKDIISYGSTHGHLTGKQHEYEKKYNPKNLKAQKIDWTSNKWQTVEKQTFYWLLLVALDEKIISQTVYNSLDKIRLARNQVHPMNSGQKPTLKSCEKFYIAIEKTCELIKEWKKTHPKSS